MNLETNPVSEVEIRKAAVILNEVVESSHPAEVVARHFSDLDEILPGLIELNIRQARADGRPDLASYLQDLQVDLQPLLETQQHLRSQSGLPAEDQQSTGFLRLLCVLPEGEEIPPRLGLLSEALTQSGHQCTIANRVPTSQIDGFDLVVAHRPHVDPRILEGLAVCSTAEIPILLDLDVDFESMPISHPDYEHYGLGTLARTRAYTAALVLADKISVSSFAHANSLENTGHSVKVIPDGWSKQNPMWDKPVPPRHQISLGWIGATGEMEDISLIRRIMVRVIREFPQTQLVIGDDPRAYHLFDSLPESRRLFLPGVSYEDYPYLLGQIDILLLPLRQTPYNRSATDRYLMEAGIKRIPWVASSMPAFLTWGAGGLIAEGLDEWHTCLRQLVMDRDLRTALGRAGRQLAMSREMDRLSKEWLSLFRNMLSR